jgi:hypothetical protein
MENVVCEDVEQSITNYDHATRARSRIVATTKASTALPTQSNCPLQAASRTLLH